MNVLADGARSARSAGAGGGRRRARVRARADPNYVLGRSAVEQDAAADEDADEAEEDDGQTMMRGRGRADGDEVAGLTDEMDSAKLLRSIRATPRLEALMPSVVPVIAASSKHSRDNVSLGWIPMREFLRKLRDPEFEI